MNSVLVLAALRKVRAYFVLLNLNWPPSPVGKLEDFIDLGQSSLVGRGSMGREFMSTMEGRFYHEYV